MTVPKRPDRAEALKNAHEVVAHEKWFREQVRASIDDPRPSISDEEASARMEQVFARLAKKDGG